MGLISAENVQYAGGAAQRLFASGYRITEHSWDRMHARRITDLGTAVQVETADFRTDTETDPAIRTEIFSDPKALASYRAEIQAGR